jgi:hypothetical protein
MTLYVQGVLTIAPESGPSAQAIRTTACPGALKTSLPLKESLLRVEQLTADPGLSLVALPNALQAVIFPAMPGALMVRPL